MRAALIRLDRRSPDVNCAAFRRIYPVDPIATSRSNHVRHMAMENVAAIFGKVLREQRNARGISQEALALSANVDRTFVSQMERGIRQPTLTTLCKLCRSAGYPALDTSCPRRAAAPLGLVAMHQSTRRGQFQGRNQL